MKLFRIFFYLCLSNSKTGSELSPFWKGQVLGSLEPSLQLLNLKGGVDAAWLPNLFPFPVDPGDKFPMLNNAIPCNTMQRMSTWEILSEDIYISMLVFS